MTVLQPGTYTMHREPRRPSLTAEQRQRLTEQERIAAFLAMQVVPALREVMVLWSRLIREETGSVRQRNLRQHFERIFSGLSHESQMHATAILEMIREES